jgi:hypothetical protein
MWGSLGHKEEAHTYNHIYVGQLGEPYTCLWCLTVVSAPRSMHFARHRSMIQFFPAEQEAVFQECSYSSKQ